MTAQWISIRNAYPDEEGMYKIKDCRHSIEGTAHYDGYEFSQCEFEKSSSKILFLVVNLVTHWKPIESSFS